MTLIGGLVAAGMLARWGAQTLLALLNAAHVRRHAGAPPPGALAVMSEEAFRRSADYTLAKTRFGLIEDAWDVALLAAVLFSGVLPAAWQAWSGRLGSSDAAAAAFFVVILLVLTVPGLPFDWWGQFRLEQRFGFNRSTLKLWIVDRLKGAVLAIILGFPLAWLLFALVGWIGSWWWLVGWGVFFVFQLVLVVVYPMFILPWFNRLDPLPDGALRERLLNMARKAAFRASSIQVMDGSKRSGHSNAFFTGFGRFRRIVLFDTLVQQLEPPELEAVLAHEIGHYKLGHIPLGLAISAATTLGAFALLGSLAGVPEFSAAFGFSESSIAIVFLLFVLIGGVFGFWLAPLGNALSRRHEYQADAFARDLVGDASPMVHALRKLARENLSNLTPHPWFSGFHYSHPTLVEREAALARGPAS
jgi:STE24 endopeptidase